MIVADLKAALEGVDEWAEVTVRTEGDTESCDHPIDARIVGEDKVEFRILVGDPFDGPYVCPGCHAVAPERCAPGCIDAEIEEDLERDRDNDFDEYYDRESEP